MYSNLKVVFVGVVRVGDTTYIDVSNSDETAKVRAVKIQFPKDKSFTFDIELYCTLVATAWLQK